MGFWRSAFEVTSASVGLALLWYASAWLLGPVWTQILLLPFSVALYAWGAWRLRPGGGARWRRGGRALAWAVTVGLLAGGAGWLLLALMPISGEAFGFPGEPLRISLGQYLANSLLIVGSLFLPTRALLALWAAGRTRLRWQLTFSFLLVGVLTTLLLPLGLGAFIGVSSLWVEPVVADPLKAARRASAALDPLLRRRPDPGELDAVLRGLLDGSVRLPLRPEQRSKPGETPAQFTGIRRLLVLRPDGTLWSGAGAEVPTPGNALPVAEAGRMALLLAQTGQGGCVGGRPARGLLSDSAACGIVDRRGALVATLIVENHIDSRYQWVATTGRIINTTLMVFNLVVITSLFTIFLVLALACGVGYLLARRLTRRLELLSAATNALATGDRDRRVAVDAADEVGRLGADFNTMAQRLEERERALEAEKERAERLLGANRRLVADVSHELRTPLATLRGYLEVLENEYGDRLPAHDLAVIQKQTQRLTALIDDLFTIAQAEVQRLPLRIEAVDARALLCRLADTAAPLARRERQVELVCALPADLPPLLADGERLEQVLLNLLQNALRHTPPGGIVAFEGKADQDQVTLTVADTGVGIAPDELPRIWDRFYRGDSSRARVTGGAGLGLALVRELVTAMGGSVSVESTPGQGSRFHIALARPDVTYL